MVTLRAAAGILARGHNSNRRPAVSSEQNDIQLRHSDDFASESDAQFAAEKIIRKL